MAAYPPPSGQRPPRQPQHADPYVLEVMSDQEQSSPHTSQETPYHQPPPPGEHPQEQQRPPTTDPSAPQGMPYQQPPLRGPYAQSPSRYSQQPVGPYAQTPTRAPLQPSRNGTVSHANADDDQETPKGLVVVAVLIAVSSVATIMGACIDTVPVTGSIFVVTAFGGVGCPVVLLNAFFLFAISGVASFLTSLLVLANGARGRTRCLYGAAIAFEIMSSLVYFIAPAVITAMTLMLMPEDFQLARLASSSFRLLSWTRRYGDDRYTGYRETYVMGTFCDLCYKPYIAAFSLLWIFWLIGLVLRITYIVLICRAMKNLPK